jgi:hypothetical protein
VARAGPKDLLLAATRSISRRFLGGTAIAPAADMMKERAWLAGVFAGVLAAGLVATWNAGEPSFEGSLASAASRHRTTATRPEAVVEPVRPAPDPNPDPVPAPKVVPRSSTPRPPPEPLAFIADVPDVAVPPATPAVTLDDLFPPVARGATAVPCFDRLQGIGGLSPCGAATPRGAP